jgi:hypothetical protein
VKGAKPMKCAIPGMYGRKVPIESSTIRDDFINQNILKNDNNNLTPEEIAKELQEHWDQIYKDREKLYISYGRGCGKTQFQDQMFKEYMEQLLQKDKEEHDK